MTPEKIAEFVADKPHGATRLVLMRDQGLGSLEVSASWSIDEIVTKADRSKGGPSMVETIEEEAQHAADQLQEVCRFSLQWHNKAGHVLKSRMHRVAPAEAKSLERAGVSGMPSEPISANRIVQELLQSLEAQQKVLPASIGIVLQAHERVLAIQNQMIERLAVMNEQHQLKLAELPAHAMSRDPTELEVRAQQLKVAGLEKLIDIGPDVLSLFLQWVAERAGFKAAGKVVEAAATSSTAPNGSGGH